MENWKPFTASLDDVEWDDVCLKLWNIGFDCMMKCYDYALGQVCDDDQPDTKEICTKMNSLVQQRKYTKAKQELVKLDRFY